MGQGVAKGSGHFPHAGRQAIGMRARGAAAEIITMTYLNDLPTFWFLWFRTSRTRVQQRLGIRHICVLSSVCVQSLVSLVCSMCSLCSMYVPPAALCTCDALLLC